MPAAFRAARRLPANKTSVRNLSLASIAIKIRIGLRLKNTGVIKLSSPATHEFWEIPVLFEDEHAAMNGQCWNSSEGRLCKNAIQPVPFVFRYADTQNTI